MGCKAGLIPVNSGKANRMPDESTLRKKAREAMQAGKLPSYLPRRMWGGPGVGACCAICGRTAGPDEVEFELEFIRDDAGDLDNHHVHLQCFAAWELERVNFEPVGGARSSNHQAISEMRPAASGTEAEGTA